MGTSGRGWSLNFLCWRQVEKLCSEEVEVSILTSINEAHRSMHIRYSCYQLERGPLMESHDHEKVYSAVSQPQFGKYFNISFHFSILRHALIPCARGFVDVFHRLECRLLVSEQTSSTLGFVNVVCHLQSGFLVCVASSSALFLADVFWQLDCRLLTHAHKPYAL